MTSDFCFGPYYYNPIIEPFCGSLFGFLLGFRVSSSRYHSPVRHFKLFNQRQGHRHGNSHIEIYESIK
jgi:hypothetical protein